ncbi:hypothetical protein [Methanobrevibacter millerae]|uniref:Uncharacterized protein n=1 Tax=Methanobrevibacter millerae TaxID=230361 RepID=A0A1G5V979_9EURY|nr:hypothetical protein [Methanobrevibacter millerae]SDA42389.1 hypothetical protein SAMN02910315_00442 [Methanobrevibacter millerae]
MIKNRIKIFIDLIAERNTSQIYASELKTPEDEYDDEFMGEIKDMEACGFINAYNLTNSSNSRISLTSKGAFYGKEFIENYEKLFNEVVALIRLENFSSNRDVIISQKLEVPTVFVGAVFEDLCNQNLVKIKQGASGLYIYKFTDRGTDYFSNLEK